MDYFERQKVAADELRGLLKRPVAEEPQCQSVEDFDPWEMFPCLYGSYSQAFDEMALDVLRSLHLAATDNWDAAIALKEKETLAHEMFREMLCNADLCDYGTSPRVCFANEEFAELLPAYIEKWEAYARMHWGEPA